MILFSSTIVSMILSLPRACLLVHYYMPFYVPHFREYLVKNKYAAPDKVIINGSSNGGN